MDTLFLGIPDVVPRGFLWFFSREFSGARGRTSAGTTIHDHNAGRPESRYILTPYSA